MKTATLVLVLAFAALQTVAFADCCCLGLCRSPGEVCPDEPPADDAGC